MREMFQNPFDLSVIFFYELDLIPIPSTFKMFQSPFTIYLIVIDSSFTIHFYAITSRQHLSTIVKPAIFSKLPSNAACT